MSFTDWYDGGFTDLVSITAPGGVISPLSTLQPGGMGKAPGLLTSQGWVGYNWRHRVPSRGDVAAWQAGDGGLGLRLGRFVAVDIDVLDEDESAALTRLARKMLGPAPQRVGRAPKSLLLYRTEELLTKQRVVWGEHAVEILAEGSQCVIEGIHPGTGRPYQWGPEWPVTVLGMEALTQVTLAGVTAFLTAVEARQKASGHEVGLLQGRIRTGDVDQGSLKAPIAEVTRLVQLLPNTTETHPDRLSYIRVGAAIKASTVENPAEGRELWLDWAARYTGEGNEEETVLADWRGLHPPYELGVSWLRSEVIRLGHPEILADAFEILEEDIAPDSTLPPPPVINGTVTFSDAWLAALFLHEHGRKVLYNRRAGGWMIWDGVIWERDETGLVGSWAGDTARAAVRYLEHAGAKEHEVKTLSRWCNSNRAVEQLLAYAGRREEMLIRSEEFDTDPWALNTPGGVIDLRTGALRPHSPLDRYCRVTSVTPADGVPVRWKAFLAEATKGDPDLEGYLQRLAGYALTGSTQEEMLAFFWGAGGNGKGTFLNSLGAAFGSYAEAATMETFLSSKMDRHPTELAVLAGARLVVAQETQEGRAWDEARIKALTGGDPVKARFMRQDFFTYTPQFTLIFAGNHRPHLHTPDPAMIRRFQLVPFDAIPARMDPTLKEALRAELPQILRWAIQGCLLWQKQGLCPPAQVTSTTQDYFEEADPLGRWLNERCLVAPNATATTQALYDDWGAWVVAAGEPDPPISRMSFSRALTRRGFQPCRVGKRGEEGRGFRGLVTKPRGEETPVPDTPDWR